MSIKVGFNSAAGEPGASRRGRTQIAIGSKRELGLIDAAKLEAYVFAEAHTWAEEVQLELSKYPVEPAGFKQGDPHPRGSVFDSDIAHRFRKLEPAAGAGEGNQYVRTFRLAYGWGHRVGPSHGSIVVEFTNSVRDRWGRYYANFVQGSWQTGFHEQHGWRTVQTIVNSKSRDFVDRIQAGISRALGV